MKTGHRGTSGPVAGRLMMLGSTLGFAMMGLCAKLLPATINSHEKVFLRATGSLLMILALVGITRRRIGRPGDLKGLTLRGVWGTLALLCLFFAIDHAGLVKATLYCYMYPVFAALIAWVELGERPTSRALGALLLALVGVILTLDTNGWVPRFATGDVVGLAAGALSGAAITSVRKLRQSENTVWIVIFFTGVSSLIAAPLMLPRFVWPGAWELPLILGMAGFATVAQLLMTAGYRHLTAVEGSTLSLVTVPMSAVAATMVVGERLAPRFWLGAVLVFAATVIMTLQRSASPPAAAEIPVD